MKEIHRSKMLDLFHDKNKQPKDVVIDYCTQDGKRIKDLTVRITSVQNRGQRINVVLPKTQNTEHRALRACLVLSVDGIRIR